MSAITAPPPPAGPGAGPTSAVRSGPRPSAVRRGVKLAAALAAVVVLYAIASAALTGDDGTAYLDPASPDSGGTRALAEILRDRGVDVDGVDGVDGALAPGRPSTTVVVYPGRLSGSDLDELADATRAGGDVVLIAPDFYVLDAIGLPLREQPAVDAEVRDPGCDLAEAGTAGAALVGGGLTYAAGGSGSGAVTSCYPGAGAAATLAVLPASGQDDTAFAGRFVVLSGAEFMTNRYLDEEGNAALAIGLLNRHARLSWLIPAVAGPEAVSGGGLFDLLGSTFWSVCAQLTVGLVLLALWRGRRLGPPVPEPLPVVVRAAETVEGRGRLYAAAHARDRAAAALRAGAAARLADKLGLPVRVGHGTGPGPVAGGPDPQALAASVADHTGRPPIEIMTLLYGSGMTHPGAFPVVARPAGQPGQPVPAQGMPAGPNVAGPDPQDTELLRLAHDLDTLDRQVGTR